MIPSHVVIRENSTKNHVVRRHKIYMPSPRSQWRKYEWEQGRLRASEHIYSMGTVYISTRS